MHLCYPRQATFNIQWPQGNNKRLAPKFVTVEEAEGVITGTGAGTPRASAAPVAAAAPAATPAESPRVGTVLCVESGTHCLHGARVW